MVGRYEKQRGKNVITKMGFSSSGLPIDYNDNKINNNINNNLNNNLNNNENLLTSSVSFLITLINNN